MRSNISLEEAQLPLAAYITFKQFAFEELEPLVDLIENKFLGR